MSPRRRAAAEAVPFVIAQVLGGGLGLVVAALVPKVKEPTS
ncbi:hypothetical protein ACFWNN_34505 [Lentzea sp. NPDC058450]